MLILKEIMVSTGMERRRSWKMEIKRKFEIFFWLFILAGLFPTACFIYLWHSMSCDHEILSVLSGPGPLETETDASVILETCYSQTVQVELKDTLSGKKSHILEYQPGKDNVDLKWIDQYHLDVSVPEAESVSLELVKWGQVNINYHFQHIVNP